MDSPQTEKGFKMSAQEQERWWHRPTQRRRVDLFLLLAVGLLICVPIYPLLNSVGLKLGELLGVWPWWIRHLVVALLSGSVWLLLIRLGGFRLRDILIWTGSSRSYPPIWFFVVIGAVFYLLAIRFLYNGAQSNRTFLQLPYLLWDTATLLFGLIAVVAWDNILLERRPRLQQQKSAPTNDEPRDLPGLLKDPEALIRWLQKEKPIEYPSDDVFGLAVVARRITRILREKPLKTIGLVGAYGCGKTSILNLVEYCLNTPDELAGYLRAEQQEALYPSGSVIICKVAGWGFREGSAAEHVLKAAVQELSRHVDCLGLVGLPSHYRSAISNMGSAWGNFLVTLVHGLRDPIAILTRMDMVLKCIGMRLIIYLEDIDRNVEHKVLRDEVASLLDRLKDLENVSFILAIGQEQKMAGVLTRISEHVETVLNLAPEEVVRLCVMFRKFCLEWYKSDIDCCSKDDREKRVGLDTPFDPLLFALLGGGYITPIESVAKLLITPRVTKTALRRTWQAWQALHGELDFDDLLVANTLRAGAPEAFAFLVERVPDIRALNSSTSEERDKKLNEKVVNEWGEYTAEVEWDTEAGNHLIDFLFPGWIRGTFSKADAVPQGVARSEPTDYWVRLNAEEISSDEIQDQKVMQALITWERDRAAKAYGRLTLARAIFEVNSLADKVEQFGTFFLDGNQVRLLTSELFEIILREKEPRRKGEEYSGFIQLWRLALDTPVDDHERWVIEEIGKALPVSLGFANDLYYYWRHSRRAAQLDRVKTPAVRNGMIQKAKEHYEDNPEALVEALEPGFIYSIYQFSILYSQPERGGESFRSEQWKWLFDVLSDAAAKNPRIVVPQIVGLLPRKEERAGPYFNQKYVEKVAELFGPRLREVMRLLDQDIDTSEFNADDVKQIQFAGEIAEKWLSEHGVEASPS